MNNYINRSWACAAFRQGGGESRGVILKKIGVQISAQGGGGVRTPLTPPVHAPVDRGANIIFIISVVCDGPTLNQHYVKGWDSQ